MIKWVNGYSFVGSCIVHDGGGFWVVCVLSGVADAFGGDWEEEGGEFALVGVYGLWVWVEVV